MAAAAAVDERFIKVCGVTNVEDAHYAASCGANMIGMILCPKAKRSIPPHVAREISAIARQHNAIPVGVFVDEDAATIAEVCKASDVDVAQLHGNGARHAVLDLPSHLRTVYVMHADKSGTLQTPLPTDIARGAGRELTRVVDWILLDSLQGGSGERFDWSSLNPPVHACSRGWLLAGGLTPANVTEAIATAAPTGVDVSSGVCGPDGLKKDYRKVSLYIEGAVTAFKM